MTVFVYVERTVSSRLSLIYIEIRPSLIYGCCLKHVGQNEQVNSKQVMEHSSFLRAEDCDSKAFVDERKEITS